MKFIKNIKLATRISLCILIVTLVGMTVLREVITQNVSSIVEENITNQMNDAVTSRAAVIEDYVSGAEHTMVEFSLSSEVRNLLKTPTIPQLLKQRRHTPRNMRLFRGFLRGFISRPRKHLSSHIPTET